MTSRRNNGRAEYQMFVALLAGLIVLFIASLRFGAIVISWSEISGAITGFFNSSTLNLQERIFMEIRFPRAVACMLVGASLSLSGVLMQGLFRNPIIEPGLIGTSSGAAFGASLYFVLGSYFPAIAGVYTLPLAACAGAVLSTAMVFFFSRSSAGGKSSVFSLLLTGIAVNALFLSAVGFMSYIARDPQARSITFWNLGTLSGANWKSVLMISLTLAGCYLFARRHAKDLNALMIGEDEAYHLGVDFKKLQLQIMVVNVILVAVSTAFVGVIAFVGLVVPHLLRLIAGSDNRILIPASVIGGALVLTAADLLARLALAPAELPIGIVTSIVGVPVFIFLLRKQPYHF